MRKLLNQYKQRDSLKKDNKRSYFYQFFSKIIEALLKKTENEHLRLANMTIQEVQKKKLTEKSKVLQSLMTDREYLIYFNLSTLCKNVMNSVFLLTNKDAYQSGLTKE